MSSAGRHAAEHFDGALHVADRLGALGLFVGIVEDQIDVMAAGGEQTDRGVEVPQVPRVVHHEQETSGSPQCPYRPLLASLALTLRGCGARTCHGPLGLHPAPRRDTRRIAGAATPTRRARALEPADRPRSSIASASSGVAATSRPRGRTNPSTNSRSRLFVFRRPIERCRAVRARAPRASAPCAAARRSR